MSNLFGHSLPESCVYLMQYSDEPIYKIGRTQHLASRLIRVQVAVPYRVEVVHRIWTDSPQWLEAYWHSRFASKRRRGSARYGSSEWFNLESDDVSEFMSHTHLDRKYEYKLCPVLPVIFDTILRQEAIRRVTKHYDNLIAHYPQHAVKLANSCKWQVEKLENLEVDAIDRAAEQKAVAHWEEQAYRAAKVKITG